MKKNIMRPKGFKNKKREKKEYDERVVEISRVSRVVKGGRRIRFRALVVIGNKNGKVGMGVSKANEVASAVKKAVSQAKKNIIEVPIVSGTIPHEVIASYSASRIVLRPASLGTSIVAGSCVRTVLELAGIKDILSKILRSRNKINNVTATINALNSFDKEITQKIIQLSKEDKNQSLKSKQISDKVKSKNAKTNKR